MICVKFKLQREEGNNYESILPVQNLLTMVYQGCFSPAYNG